MTRIEAIAKLLAKKILGKKDPLWRAHFFEHSVNQKTVRNYRPILDWSESVMLENFKNNTSDPIVTQGSQLRDEVMKKFSGKLRGLGLHIGIHLPSEKISPAGYSLFSNMAEAFSFIGVKASILHWGASTKEYMQKEHPHIFLSSDDKSYLADIDWKFLAEYRKDHKLIVGLTASLEEYGNTALKERLIWAKDNHIDFYYSFRESTYIKSRPEYRQFSENGFKIFSIPFGANPLVHYPVKIPGTSRDLDYVFIASSQMRTKGEKYYRYLTDIVTKYSGFIAGPGWRHAKNFTFNRDRDRYIYSRAKTGLNIHLDEQIQYANETNERTYQLAACGVPIVTDHAKILDTLFEKDSLFIADNPAEYKAQFEYIMKHPKEAEARALKAQKQVFQKYTTFHRAEEFVTMLATHFPLH